jgi:hypothetical protein
MTLQPVDVVVKSVGTNGAVVATKPGAGKIVKKAAKPTSRKTVDAATAATAVTRTAKAAKSQEKTDAMTARIFEDETIRRANAIARIQEAALAAGLQKSRIEIFIRKLQCRVERSCARVAKLVEAERARQAKALEAYPVLQRLPPNKKELEVAAAVPKVEIPKERLPAYINSIAEEVA